MSAGQWRCFQPLEQSAGQELARGKRAVQAVTLGRRRETAAIADYTVFDMVVVGW